MTNFLSHLLTLRGTSHALKLLLFTVNLEKLNPDFFGIPEALGKCDIETTVAKRILNISIADDGNKFVFLCGGTNTIALKSSDDWIFEPFATANTRLFKFSPDSRWLAFADDRGRSYIYNISEKSLFPQNEIEALNSGFTFKDTIRDIDFSGDSRYLLMASDD